MGGATDLGPLAFTGLVVTGALAAVIVLTAVLYATGRAAARAILARFLRRLLKDPYSENLWEIVTATWRYGAQTVLETGLRAASGEVLARPFGRPRPFPGPGFDRLMFVPAQLDTLPSGHTDPVATEVVVGPHAARPLRLDIPVLITGMAYGLALSKTAKLALARGSAAVGTATNTGEGLFFPEERREARSLIVQYNRGAWNKEIEVLRQADAIEIQLGQGAEAGVGETVALSQVGADLARAMGAPAGESPVIHSRLPDMDAGIGLGAVVRRLRSDTDGVPVGVKLAAGGRLEADLEAALSAGVDFITLDGAEAATHGAAPVLEDDFGLPTFIALCRAARALAGLAPARRPSLVVSGGLFTPAEFLKALALGADAVAIGTAALFALGHAQVAGTLPWEPPLNIVWHGRPEARRLDLDTASQTLARFLRSCVGEMCVATRALGKHSLAAVDREDLVALDEESARLAGVRRASDPWSEDRGAWPVATASAVPAAASGLPGRAGSMDAVAGGGRAGAPSGGDGLAALTSELGTRLAAAVALTDRLLAAPGLAPDVARQAQRSAAASAASGPSPNPGPGTE